MPTSTQQTTDMTNTQTETFDNFYYESQHINTILQASINSDSETQYIARNNKHELVVVGTSAALLSDDENDYYSQQLQFLVNEAIAPHMKQNGQRNCRVLLPLYRSKHWVAQEIILQPSGNNQSYHVTVKHYDPKHKETDDLSVEDRTKFIKDHVTRAFNRPSEGLTINGSVQLQRHDYPPLQGEDDTVNCGPVVTEFIQKRVDNIPPSQHQPYSPQATKDLRAEQYEKVGQYCNNVDADVGTLFDNAFMVKDNVDQLFHKTPARYENDGENNDVSPISLEQSDTFNSESTAVSDDNNSEQPFPDYQPQDTEANDIHNPSQNEASYQVFDYSMDEASDNSDCVLQEVDDGSTQAQKNQSADHEQDQNEDEDQEQTDSTYDLWLNEDEAQERGEQTVHDYLTSEASAQTDHKIAYYYHLYDNQPDQLDEQDWQQIKGQGLEEWAAQKAQQDNFTQKDIANKVVESYRSYQNNSYAFFGTANQASSGCEAVNEYVEGQLSEIDSQLKNG